MYCGTAHYSTDHTKSRYSTGMRLPRRPFGCLLVLVLTALEYRWERYCAVQSPPAVLAAATAGVTFAARVCMTLMQRRLPAAGSLRRVNHFKEDGAGCDGG